MLTTDAYIQKDRASEPGDVDALLEAADLTRQLIGAGDCPDIKRLVAYTLENRRWETFSWIMAILQEEFEKAEVGLPDFTLDFGGSLPDYDALREVLGVDPVPAGNDVETIPDETGEVQSFYQIFTYRTMYRNIFFVSRENFDTKDNDFIRYELAFVRG